jgi:AbrB family looped-hinge helix DNA binding protein
VGETHRRPAVEAGGGVSAIDAISAPEKSCRASGHAAMSLNHPMRIQSPQHSSALLRLLRAKAIEDAADFSLTSEVRCYLTGMKTTVSSKGQIVLPVEIRKQDRIETGQEFEIERLDCGEYRLRRYSAPENEGVVDWLLSCPHKGFFVPIVSESTDML